MTLLPTRTTRRSHSRKLQSGKTIKVRQADTTVHRGQPKGRDGSWTRTLISSTGAAVVKTSLGAWERVQPAARQERARRRRQYRDLSKQMRTLAKHPHLLRSVLDTVEGEADWELANISISEAGRALRDDQHRGRKRQLGRRLWRTAAWTVWAGRRLAWEAEVAEQTWSRFINAEADELFSLSHPRSPWSKSGLPAAPRMPGAEARAMKDPVKARLLARLHHALAQDALGTASQGLVPERTTRELRRPLARIMAAVVEEQQGSDSTSKMTDDELRAMAKDASYQLSEARDWAAGADLHAGVEPRPVSAVGDNAEQELTIIVPRTSA